VSVSQNEKAARFKALHEDPGAFVIPNPWDAGSARILAGLGFQALATSSAASACAMGKRDGGLTREEALAHASLIVEAADLPVSADLEKGFGDEGSSLDETISRLQAFEKAGADVLFAPGLPDIEAVRAVCSAVSKPVNFMAGIKGKSFSVGELAAAGVRRISLATSLYRAAMTGLLDAAREVTGTGQFGFLDQCVTTKELNELMRA
jgi:2-methylisocitrate lyase-like PEP mutase family enzyme